MSFFVTPNYFAYSFFSMSSSVFFVIFVYSQMFLYFFIIFFVWLLSWEFALYFGVYYSRYSLCFAMLAAATTQIIVKTHYYCVFICVLVLFFLNIEVIVNEFSTRLVLNIRDNGLPLFCSNGIGEGNSRTTDCNLQAHPVEMAFLSASAAFGIWDKHMNYLAFFLFVPWLLQHYILFMYAYIPLPRLLIMLLTMYFLFFFVFGC